MTKHVLHNPLAGKMGLDEIKSSFSELFPQDTFEFKNVTELENVNDYINAIPTDEDIIVCGGDGTISRFVNAIKDVEFNHKLWYYACGSGNDFLRDVGKDGNKLVDMTEYIKKLPRVIVQGKEYCFLNGVGYGIDGYCCEKGDEMRAKSDKPVNYTSIAINGLLFNYKPTDATIIVDGVEHKFKHVWLAPTMYGKYYGGGMIPAPEQKRGDDAVSVMAFYGWFKLGVLMVFPSIFKGEHVKHKNNIAVFSGKEITVKFDSPRTLQIDGETIFNVSEYTVKR